MERALREWASREVPRHPGLLRLGYFGSYARGDWGVGSDVDLVAVVSESAEPLERRALGWDLLDLPVPAEILVYTQAEWKKLIRGSGRFAQTLRHEVRWLFGSPETAR